MSFVTTFLLGRKPDKIEIAGQDAAMAETSGSRHSEAAVHIWMRVSYQSGLFDLYSRRRECSFRPMRTIWPLQQPRGVQFPANADYLTSALRPRAFGGAAYH
jgi:hypothetical protein